MARRLRPGDILEVALLEGGYGYLQYVGKHSFYGDAVRVRPGGLSRCPPITEELFKEGYITFYPANRAAKEKLVTVVGHLVAVPMPTVFRRSGVTSGVWLIDDESGTTAKRFLSDVERKLPIGSVWTHEFLQMRIAEGWRPEMEV